MRSSQSFTQRVLAVVRAIPEGETLSYQGVAALAGSPKAYRVVGSIMKANYDETVPCHRVIRSNGDYGQYNRGEYKKRSLLEQEALTHGR